jgi:pyruvate-formate lyase-activating enzyme
MHKLIFYGAGNYAKYKLACGLVPVCFADSDEKKHYTKLISGSHEIEILPLNEAITRYPDYKIVITVLNNSSEIYNYLLDYGIPEEKINKDVVFCPYLGRSLVMQPHGYAVCCEQQTPYIPYGENIQEDMENLFIFYNKLLSDLKKGFPTTCHYCHLLQSGLANIELNIQVLTLASLFHEYDNCNFKCCYCSHADKKYEIKYNSINVKKLSQIMEIINPAQIVYANGEITISPYRDEILLLWKNNKWNGQILTNAAIYNQDIADLMSEKLVSLLISIDAGTRETFARVKGVDCFDKVKDNIRKYAETGGKINVKYIILEGINDNDNDVKGFVKFAEEIKADIAVSRNKKASDKDMTANEYNALKMLAALCREQGIVYTVSTTNFNLSDLPRIKNLTTDIIN